MQLNSPSVGILMDGGKVHNDYDYRRFDLRTYPSSSIYLHFSATQWNMLLVCFSTKF